MYVKHSENIVIFTPCLKQRRQPRIVCCCVVWCVYRSAGPVTDWLGSAATEQKSW